MKEYDDELVSAGGVKTVGNQRSQKCEANCLFMYFDLATIFIPDA